MPTDNDGDPAIRPPRTLGLFHRIATSFRLDEQTPKDEQGASKLSTRDRKANHTLSRTDLDTALIIGAPGASCFARDDLEMVTAHVANVREPNQRVLSRTSRAQLPQSKRAHNAQRDFRRSLP